MEDLNRAIKVARASLDASSRDDSCRVRMLNTLALTLQARMIRTTSIEDAHEALQAIENVKSLTPRTDSKLPIVLTNLAAILHDRFELFGDDYLEDLDRATATAEQVSSLIHRDSPHYVENLLLLIMSVKSRFDRIKRPADLEHAIRLSEQDTST